MADAVAVLVLALQYSFIIMIVDRYFHTGIQLAIAIAVFLAFAAIAIVIWHGKRAAARSAAAWGILALLSLVLGIAFLGVDWFVPFLSGESNPQHLAGGLLGLPFTILVCPVGTMVCVAGSVRAFYISKKESPNAAAPDPQRAPQTRRD